MPQTPAASSVRKGLSLAREAFCFSMSRGYHPPWRGMCPDYESLSYAGFRSIKQNSEGDARGGTRRKRGDACLSREPKTPGGRGSSPEAAHKLDVHAVAEDEGVGRRNLRPIDDHPYAVSLLGAMAKDLL